MFYWNITWRVKVSSLNNKLTDNPLHFHQGRCTDAHCALRAAQRLQLWLWGWEAQDPRGAIWPLERQGVWAHTQDALSLIMGCDPMWSIMCLTSFFVVWFFFFVFCDHFRACLETPCWESATWWRPAWECVTSTSGRWLSRCFRQFRSYSN